MIFYFNDLDNPLILNFQLKRACLMANKGVNKVMLLGHLGREPEVRYSASGAAVATVGIATNEFWRDKQTGEQQERTEWHRVVFFGNLAEVVQKHLVKGSHIYVEGRLQTRKWQDQGGNDRYTTEIVANEMQMVGGRKEGGGRAPKESYFDALSSSIKTPSKIGPSLGIDSKYEEDITFPPA